MESGGIPVQEVPSSVALEPLSWNSPFHNDIISSSPAIMVIVPWMYMGGADIGALRMVQVFANAGYRVTVVCTLYHPPEGVELRSKFMQWTHDIHILPAFLRARDFPRYLKYLVNSRHVKSILMSNSQLGYEILPALREQIPHVAIIDYLHNEAYDGWKSGGYPAFSLASRRYLDRTVTCSHYLRNWLIERGHDQSRLGVVKLGFDKSEFVPIDPVGRLIAKKKLLAVPTDTIVVAIVARLDRQKRAMIVPDILQRTLLLLERSKKSTIKVVFLMIGDGDQRPIVESRARTLGLDRGQLRLLGTVDDPQLYLKACDIFLMPSISEGISVAISEAMAMGLPVIAARAGALPEQLGWSDSTPEALGGILVNHTLSDTIDIDLYAREVFQLAIDAERRRILGQNALRLTETLEDYADWRETLQGLFTQIPLARPWPASQLLLLPNPAAQYAIQNLLSERKTETDMLSGQDLLKAPKRTGAAALLQARCGEGTPAMTRWITSISAATTCDDEDEPIEVETLLASAKFQCGYWYVFRDLC